MADDIPASSEAAETVPAPRRWRLWKWIGATLAIVALVPILVFTVWSLVALNYSYSEGLRTGYVQKFSRKGWICKTWEGELATVILPGQAMERWLFTVRSDSIARVIQREMGNRVTLEYEEHPGLPTSCFGDTRYYVVRVKPIEGP